MTGDLGGSLIGWARDLILREALLNELECMVRNTFASHSGDR